MTSDSGGIGSDGIGSGDIGSGDGRRRGRISENAKSLAAVLTGIVALLAAVAGMITLVCSDPVGNPASAATTTVMGGGGAQAAGGAAAGGQSAGGAAPSPTAASSPGPSPSTPPPPPAPQWEGDVEVDSFGSSLATVPPSPDQSGNPDISAAFDGTFFAAQGAAEWTSPDAPSPQACATLILAQHATHLTAVLGDMYCVRVAHSPYRPGSQYAAVRIIGEGRNATNFPYVRIHAKVWPDEG